MSRFSAFIVGILVGGWLMYLWISPDPYPNVRTGDACGDERHWVVPETSKACVKN